MPAISKRPLLLSAALLLIALASLVLWTSTVQGATLTVTKLEDTNDGSCDLDCSLREAIDAAAPGDLVVLPAGTYTLTFGSQLTIDKDLTLMGAGADVTTVQAATAPGLVFYRVLEVTSGNVTISGVTLQHGNTADFGGGILNMGNLTLADSAVSNNSAFVWSGGGISNSGSLSTLTLVNSTVSGNTSEKDGGGIFSGGTLNLTNSTVSNNTVFESTGGGIANTGNMKLVNTTITANDDAGGAGGVENSGGSMDMVNTIIASNPTASSPDCSGGTITSLGNNLIGNGSGCSFVALTGDLVGTVGAPIDPLLGPLQNNGGSTDTHALLFGSQAIDGANDAAAPAADQRGVLRPQGGASDIGSYEVEVDPSAPIARVDTYAVDEDDVLIVPAPGVLANDTDPQEDTLTADLVTGTSSGALTLETDGSFTYTPDLDYNGNDSFLYVANDGLLDSNGVTVAITVSPVVDILVVTKTGDTDDGVCNEDCSLREAIGAATPGDLVDIPAGTYTLDLGSELSVEQDLTLSGAGSRDTIIQGADVLGTAGTRVLAIQNGVNANISGVTIRHGDTTGLNSGAGISNAGNLTLIDSAVTHNLAESLGGGIHNSGVAELTGTTVSGNKSGSAGGCIHNNFGGILSLNNTRVINNGAVGEMAAA